MERNFSASSLGNVFKRSHRVVSVHLAVFHEHPVGDFLLLDGPFLSESYILYHSWLVVDRSFELPILEGDIREPKMFRLATILDGSFHRVIRTRPIRQFADEGINFTARTRNRPFHLLLI